MPIVAGGLYFALAIFCAVHVVRTRQNLYWLLVLFGFPLLGSLVYFFAIYFPNSRLQRQAMKTVAAAAKAIRLQSAIDVPEGWVHGDPDRLQQIAAERRIGGKEEIVATGGAPVPTALLKRILAAAPQVEVLTGYGLTEASPVTHVNPIKGMRKEGSIGLPVPASGEAAAA